MMKAKTVKKEIRTADLITATPANALGRRRYFRIFLKNGH